jgi:hypothetical protein
MIKFNLKINVISRFVDLWMEFFTNNIKNGCNEILLLLCIGFRKSRHLDSRHFDSKNSIYPNIFCISKGHIKVGRRYCVDGRHSVTFTDFCVATQKMTATCRQTILALLIPMLPPPTSRSPTFMWHYTSITRAFWSRQCRYAAALEAYAGNRSSSWKKYIMLIGL